MKYMEKIKKLNEFYSERVNEVELKLDHVYENLDKAEISSGLLEFLKAMDDDVEGIYEDAIDYLIETKLDGRGSWSDIRYQNSDTVKEVDELSSDDENPTFIKKFEEK